MKSVKWHIAVRRIVTALSHKRLQSFVIRSPPQHVSPFSHMPQHGDPAALAPLVPPVPPSPHALPAHPFPGLSRAPFPPRFPPAFPARLSPALSPRAFPARPFPARPFPARPFPGFPARCLPRVVSRMLLSHAVSLTLSSRTPSARPLPAASPGASPRTTSPRPSAATAPPVRGDRSARPRGDRSARPRRPLRPSAATAPAAISPPTRAGLALGGLCGAPELPETPVTSDPGRRLRLAPWIRRGCPSHVVPAA